MSEIKIRVVIERGDEVHPRYYCCNNKDAETNNGEERELLAVSHL